LNANTHFEPNDILWVTYDELINGKDEIVSRIFSKFGFNYDKENILDSLAEIKNEDTRLNVGISGRGRSMLSDRQKSRIHQIAQHYPNTDFSLILA
jgi:hypothetical protein